MPPASVPDAEAVTQSAGTPQRSLLLRGSWAVLVLLLLLPLSTPTASVHKRLLHTLMLELL